MANIIQRVVGVGKRLIDFADAQDPTGKVKPYAEHMAATLVDTDGVALTALPGLPAALAASGGLKVEGVLGGVLVSVGDTWVTTVVTELTTGDSDKILTVPASTQWELQAMYVTLTTNATVGDRQLAVFIMDSSDMILAKIVPNVVQAASLTRNYSFAVGNPDDTAFYDTDLLRVTLPPMRLGAGYKLRVYDNNVVAAAADNMYIHLTVLAR